MSYMQRIMTRSLRSVIWFTKDIIIGTGNWMYVCGYITWLSKRIGDQFTGSVTKTHAKHLRAASIEE